MSSTKELLVESQKAIGEYIELSNYLFAEDAPLQINDIPSNNKFYPVAHEIVEELGLKWDNVNRNDSNRIMLEMLAEYFVRIKDVEGFKPLITVSFMKEG